ncbi:MAG: protein kinase [Oscillospiraceae bacterium]|nr:protein kinase [Oscillospiraceae bacterium]
MNDEIMERNEELEAAPPAEDAAEPMVEEATKEILVESAPPAEETDGETVAEESTEEEPTEEETPESEEIAQEEDGMDGIALALQLCDAVLAAVGRDGFHGGVRPDNIVVGEEGVTLGSRLEHGVGEFTPQELEYMAPELFWDGVRGSAGDVYSLGLVLYSIYNGGRMPFWPEQADATPNLRASTLQKRMSRQEISAPVNAGEELSAIILRALAFSVEERWADVQELRNALSDCQEPQHAAGLRAVVAGLSARGAVPRRAPEKTLDDEIRSPFVEEPDDDMNEAPIPKVKVRRTNRRLAQIIVYTILALAIVAIIFLLRRCDALDKRVPDPTHSIEATQPPDDAVKVINGNQIEADVTPTPAPTPEPTPEPTEPPVITYTAYQENVSWSEAAARCKAMGGELAMPANYAEFLQITQACDAEGLTYAWLGARRDESGNWITTTGEPATFFAWGDGEPSEQDTDGTPEDYYLLWNLGDRWSGNDSRENPLDGFWGAYAGRIGYVCKMIETPGDEAADAAE